MIAFVELGPYAVCVNVLEQLLAFGGCRLVLSEWFNSGLIVTRLTHPNQRIGCQLLPHVYNFVYLALYFWYCAPEYVQDCPGRKDAALHWGVRLFA